MFEFKDKEIKQIFITENLYKIQNKLKELSSSSLINSEIKEVFRNQYAEGERVIQEIADEVFLSKERIIEYVENLKDGEFVNTTSIISNAKFSENCLYCKYKEATEMIQQYLKIDDLIND